MVLLVPACTPVTPTRSLGPFSIVGWSITRDSRLTACLSPSLSHNSMSLIIKHEIVASGSACACFTAFSIHTKTQCSQSQKLLLILKKLRLPQPCCFTKTSATEVQNKEQTAQDARNDLHMNYATDMNVTSFPQCHSQSAIN